MRARIFGAALTALLLVGVSGCSGDSSKTAASDDSDTKSSASNGSGSEAAFCKELKEVDAQLSGSPSDTSAIPDALDRLAATAPSEIRADLQTLADAAKIETEILDSVGNDLSALESALDEISDSIDDAKLDQAMKNLETFAKDRCGVDLASASSDNSFSVSGSSIGG